MNIREYVGQTGPTGIEGLQGVWDLECLIINMELGDRKGQSLPH